MKALLFICSIFINLSLFSQTNLSSLEFDGVNDHLEVANILSGNTEGSIELWVNVLDWGSGTGGSYLFSGFDGNVNGNGLDRFNLGIHPPSSSISNELVFGMYTSNGFGGNSWYFAHSNLDISDSLYHHIVGTWGSSGIKLFVDGVLVGSNSFSGPVPVLNHTFLGGSSWVNSYVKCTIDEFRFWDSELDSTLVNQYMDCSPPYNEPDILGYWDLEEGSGLTSIDHTPNNNTVDLVNGVNWSSINHINNCCNAYSVLNQPLDQNVSVGSSTSLSFTDDYTGAVYQWQIDSISGFVNLSNFGQFMGVNLNTLNVNSLTLSNHNNRFRCLISTPSGCVDTTNVAELWIDEKSVSTLEIAPEDFVVIAKSLNLSCSFPANSIDLIRVYSLLGKIELDFEIENNKVHFFTTHNLNKGFYLIEAFKKNKSVASQKIIIQ